MRCVIILGAGDSQLPAYRAARRLGYHVIGVDRSADAPAAGCADTFVQISVRDADAIVKRIGERDVAGVLALGSDAGLATQRTLATHYRTPHVTSRRALRASTDKGWFRRLVGGLGYPTYAHMQSNCLPDLIRATSAMPLPLVVKPADSCGSKGVRVVVDRDALTGALAHAQSHSPTGTVIVEEHVSGRHFGAEAFFEGGRLKLLAVTERTLGGWPSMVTISHRMPAECDAATRSRLVAMVDEVCRAVDIETGPVNFDVVLDAASQLHLVEMGARLGGGGLASLIPAALGVDTAEAAVRAATGEPARLTPRWHRCALWYALHSARDGVLKSVAGTDWARSLPEVASLQILARPGSRVRQLGEARDKLGTVTLVADSPAHLDRALRMVLGALHFEVSMDACGAVA